MNVFCLDKDPVIAAEMMCDKHIVKMIIEYSQILSAVVDVNYMNEYKGKDNIKPSKRLGLPGYPPNHIKHPSTMWTIESKGNAKWLLKHLRATIRQYQIRYNKRHKLEGCLMIYDAQMKYLSFPKNRKTEFVQAITDKRWHKKDPIEAYRTYYNMEKFMFAKWKLGNIPYWFTGPPIYNIELE